METYTLPREAFNMFEQTLGGRENAEILARTLETAIGSMQQRAKEEIIEQKQILKVVLKDELSRELVTRDLFEERFKVVEERFNSVDEKFKSLNFKLNIFIALAFAALTFANPAFVELIKAIF